MCVSKIKRERDSIHERVCVYKRDIQYQRERKRERERERERERIQDSSRVFFREIQVYVCEEECVCVCLRGRVCVYDMCVSKIERKSVCVCTREIYSIREKERESVILA